MNNKYIKASLEDKELQSLIDEKCKIQVDEMVDNKWYPDKIEEIDKKIKERGDWIRANCN